MISCDILFLFTFIYCDTQSFSTRVIRCLNWNKTRCHNPKQRHAAFLYIGNISFWNNDLPPFMPGDGLYNKIDSTYVYALVTCSFDQNIVHIKLNWTELNWSEGKRYFSWAFGISAGCLAVWTQTGCFLCLLCYVTRTVSFLYHFLFARNIFLSLSLSLSLSRSSL